MLVDEDGNEFAIDSAENGHDGQIMGNVEWVDGKFGGGLEFPGVGGTIVNVPHSEDLNLSEFTITYWCKMGETGGWQIPVAKVDGGHRNVDFQTPAGGGSVGIYFTQGDAQWKGAEAKTTITDKEWHHIVGSYDLETLRIYIDGVVEGEGKHKGEPDHVDTPLTLGDMTAGSAMLGILDDVGIFNKALSDDDIQNIMNNGLDKVMGISPVFPVGKLTTTWAEVKVQN